ncbi:histidine kinase [Catenulispora yoronensis]|uniref:histidine kinase n=1 Tax=Catenulispora yoronensis TaxID=450799 RepID=A0ABP5G3L6_9ACTN
MAQDGRPSLRQATSAARLVESAREQILGTYAERLTCLNDDTAGDSARLRQSLANAGQLLSEVVSNLRGGLVAAEPGGPRTARDAGASQSCEEEHQEEHPKESIQEASAFFQAALASTALLIEPGPDWIDLYLLVALALEESLTLRMHESVSSYTGFLLKQFRCAQVTERRRIARDLHDRIGNSVSVAHRQLELYDLYRTSQPSKADAKVEAAQRAIAESMRNLRVVASDLHPRDQVKNLEKALRTALRGANTDGVDVTLTVRGEESGVPCTVLDQTLLILREAVINALRHASATTLTIEIDVTPDELRASVADDGRGFDPGRAPADRHGVGLKSMVERAELLHGTLCVSSRIGAGTRVVLWAPLKGPADADADAVAE